ncbi:NtaA/DmoA family FMN-dependent monooxygenase [Amycolatopsis sp. K13G38]|uniref:NtaA/DmoA family FMN-dependent monooxygenase n=2 Tax=Amycolatopsis acididurans TaxID=2724524 RepID=A0ABX1IW32_9PSEU|nr:NtaA/DmoA family FMN-dependent monooxygenase [Amycolatopsis acididurans]
MALIAFLQAQNCSNYVGSWRAPASASDFLTAEYFARIARTLEDGRFDMAFFDDRLAMPDIYDNSHELAVRHGIRSVKMDPTVVMTVMAMATRHLGVASTYSTTYYEPFHVARHFATLDLMTGGRAAWNVVTSLNDSEAANFGRGEHLEHDLRYDRADEFVDIVTRMWATWEPDALVVDKETGFFADPAKVHRLEHDGKFFTSHGTFPVPPSPQGRPVLLQAGASGRGMAFAANWADVIFTHFANVESGTRTYVKLRQGIEDAGRDPASVVIAPLINVVTAETPELVERKQAMLEGLARDEDALALLCEALNTDFGTRPYDEPFTDTELRAMSYQGLRDRVITLSGKENPSVRDFVEFSGRGKLREAKIIAGTPDKVADQLEELHGTCADGFVLAAASVPGTYDDFSRLVSPVLRKRGLLPDRYEASTLRENLGLPPAGETRDAA